MTTLPVFYSFRRCPYAMRARLAVLASEQTVELREVVLRDKAPNFLETSPSATVPCLKEGETVLDESLDIMIWALEKADPGNWLSPPEGKASQMMDLIAECDGPFKTHLDRYKYDTRYEGANKLEEREGGVDVPLDARQDAGGTGLAVRRSSLPGRFRHSPLRPSIRQCGQGLV